MINPNEAAEKKHLQMMLKKLNHSHKLVADQIAVHSKGIQSDADYIWQNKSDMDGVEKAGHRLAVQQRIGTRDETIIKKHQLERLLQSPYFGRIDFMAHDDKKKDAYYIGMHTFLEKEGDNILIYDWRAPISSMFYDFECGKAHYHAPMGVITGDIKLKRQYKIEKGDMAYMIESAVNIHDDVLQKELNNSSSEKMRNIVVTIQREQNAVIRNATANTLIVQGVAGSGKTSIALHRVAFLLYRFKGTLASDNIMIISPNKVFASYIANVLPELGENNIIEIGLDELAQQILGDKIACQTFGQQVASLEKSNDATLIDRIRYKASKAFVDDLSVYLKSAATSFFQPDDLHIDGLRLTKDTIRSCYLTFDNLPIRERLKRTCDHAVARMGREYDRQIPTASKNKIKTAITSMFRFKDAKALYMHFYEHNNLVEMHVAKKGGAWPYEDLFPLIYTKLFFDDVPSYSFIRHLLVDEMQDYTPIQYAVLLKLFSCKMTILGDANQSVNPYSSSSLSLIREIFPDAECVKLCKSYRSTYDITLFAQNISHNDTLTPVERYGTPPSIYMLPHDEAQLQAIRKLIGQHLKSAYPTLGIICKTDAMATKLFEQVRDMADNIFKIDFSSSEYRPGIIITSAHMSKGLEFDHVIIPYVDDTTYSTELDRRLLYIACTRAMHRLELTCSGKLTLFLEKNTDFVATKNPSSLAM